MYLEPIRRPKPPTRAGLILALYGGLSLIAILIAAGRDDIDIYRIDGVSTATTLMLSPILGLAVGLAVVLCSRASVKRYEWARGLHRDFRALLGELSSREIFVLACASAVGEELLFRGALQPILGVWLQAVVFAMLHVGPSRRFLPWTLWALFMGLVFGFMFRWTGDLGGPIVAHFAINFLNLHFISKVELPEAAQPCPSVGAQAS